MGLTFTYYLDVQIISLEPNFISMRAHDDGQEVTIYGNGFIDSGDLMVRVNQELITPTFISEQEITFLPPKVLSEGQYFVYVSNNNYDFQRASSNLYITYYLDFYLNSLSVNKVQIGSHLLISAYGEGFPTSGTFYCVLAAGDITLYYYVQVEFVSSTEVKCVVPKYEFLVSLTSVSFQLSYNLEELVGDLVLIYYEPIQISSYEQTAIAQSES